MVDFTDILPTLATVAGTDTSGLTLDGQSLLTAGGARLDNKDTAYLWYDPRGRNFDAAEFAQEDRYKLYADGRMCDLVSDPTESSNLASGSLTSEQQTVRDQLQQVLDFYRIEQLGGEVSLAASTVDTIEDEAPIGIGSGDDQGNQVVGNQLIVGDNGQNNREYRTVFEFDLSDDLAEDVLSLGLESASFEVTVTLIKGGGPDLRLIALTTDEDGVINADDYEASGELVATIDGDTLAEGDLIQIDVTDFVLDDANQQFTAFWLESVGPMPNGPLAAVGSSADQLRLGGAVGDGNGTSTDARLVLTAVPEPTTATLLLAGAAGLVGRRTRRPAPARLR
jgi:hypothetical protein